MLILFGSNALHNTGHRENFIYLCMADYCSSVLEKKMNPQKQAYKIRISRMPRVPAEALGHFHLKSWVPPLQCPHMQSCLVHEFPKVYPLRGYGLPLPTECIGRSLSKLHGLDTRRNPALSLMESLRPWVTGLLKIRGTSLVESNHEREMPYTDRVHGRPQVRRESLKHPNALYRNRV